MVILVMGVTGAGKTTIGALLADKLGWKFADADSFHPPANVQKMSHGVPLDDTDREPWLNVLSAAIAGWISEKENVVLACSALKRAYRRAMGAEASQGVRIVYLKGSYGLIFHRLLLRRGHFASESILVSQFADLEEPQQTTPSGDMSSIVVDVAYSPLEIVAEILIRLNLGEAGRNALASP